jgi:hypothetical protein
MRSWLRLALALGISGLGACGKSAADSGVLDAGRGAGPVGENEADSGYVPDATLPNADEATDAGDAGVPVDEASTDAAVAPPIVCPEVTLDAGDSTGTLILDGGGRTYNLHIPPGLDLSRPAPLVFALHGGGQTAAQFEGFAHVQPKADSSGFILVETEGTPSLPGLAPDVLDVWNAGNCCELAAEINTNVDDVGFVRALIDTLSQQLCIDPKRIFARSPR